MTSFDVNHQQLAESGAKTADKSNDARSIEQKVSGAEGLVPEKAWGLLGDLTVFGVYSEMLGTFKDHMTEMVAGVQKLGDDIKATAEEYRQNESDTEEKFKDIAKELGGSANATVPGGSAKAV